MDEEERLYKQGMAIGYRWQQTKDGQAKFDDVVKGFEKRRLIHEGMIEGRELAIWEQQNNTMEKVSKEYKESFNLSYTLRKEKGGHLYDDLIKLYDNSPAFKNTDIYKGLIAGKEQADKEEREFYRQNQVVEPHDQNRNEMLHAEKTRSEPLKSDEAEKGVFGKVKDFVTDKVDEVKTKLAEKDLQNWEAHINKGEQQLKEGLDTLQKDKEALEREKEIQRFMNKGKGKDHERE